MSVDDRLVELLLRWEESLEDGLELTAQQLCPDDEGLCADLQNWITNHRRLQSPSSVSERPRSAMASSPTPVSLLERMRRDDKTAWARFVDLYTPVLFGWARQIGLQDADAGDLVQEVFAVLVQKLADFQYDPARSFRGWLKTVALNKLRDRKRRAGELQVDEAWFQNLADSSERFWEEEFRRNLVRRAIQIMKNDFQPTTWQACWEVIVHDRPAAEVAHELKITVGAVYAARSRVLLRLRSELAGMFEE